MHVCRLLSIISCQYFSFPSVLKVNIRGVARISAGGLPKEARKQRRGFEGCMQNLILASFPSLLCAQYESEI